MAIVLGLDCALKTGWAIYDSGTGKIIESGVESFAKQRGESNGIVFLRYRNWLHKLMGFVPAIDIVIYEQAHYRGGAATEVCVGLTTRVQEVSEYRKIAYGHVRTRELKLWATGKGNASKAEMIEAARAVLGREPIDDNEADAVHIARWGGERYA